MTSPVIVIGGPTASGKSGLALDIARHHGGVIINADSMQMYDGLHILTAQPSAEEKSAVPHRLYGAFTADDMCSAALWRDRVLVEIDAARNDGKLPVIVGGTGFYIKTLLEGVSPIPDVPPEIRAQAIARQQELGNPAFHAELAARDPETAAKIDPYNTQRNVRAREVLEATGKGLAHWHATPPVLPPAHLSFTTIALLPPRDALYRHCDRRFDMMLDAGALEEARAFRAARGGKPSPLDKALGYPELCDYMDGRITLDDARDKSKQSTRNYAKRQTTWFRNQLAADIVLEKAADWTAAALFKD